MGKRGLAREELSGKSGMSQRPLSGHYSARLKSVFGQSCPPAGAPSSSSFADRAHDSLQPGSPPHSILLRSQKFLSCFSFPCPAPTPFPACWKKGFLKTVQGSVRSKDGGFTPSRVEQSRAPASRSDLGA